ncbi:hypothetical protein EWM64_g4836 [Hericium alpestre]|uniref:RRM domain-containing protein n=1 Tax=Hericium alpestre TaxID=135208 RepID=A0A4Y9ZWB6_9AGAM|nr:hypothetical protein EWM64_g4836 [Hericium alpestre]
MYSPLIPSAQRNHLLSPDNTPSNIRQTLTISMLSEFPLLLSGQIKLHVPVFTVVGACEDVFILEKIRTGQYSIDNLHILDEATTRLLDIGGVKLRLLGLGGAFVPHKMFDNGDGNATIAGGGGTIWTTVLQIGELVDTAQRVFDPSETRLLVTHASPGREGILASLALVLKADLTLSAGLHFRYATSWNEFSVQGDYDGFRHKLLVGKQAFDKVWESVKTQVDAVIDDHQRVLLDKALSVIERIPPPLGQPGPGGAVTGEEPAWKNCWNWNLCDAAYGSLVLDIKEGRVSAELKSQGFNYAYRRTATPSTGTVVESATTEGPPQTTSGPSVTHPATKAGTPVPVEGSSTPGKQFSPQTKLNGNGASPSPAPAASSPVEKSEKDKERAEREKQKKKEKKERKEKERAEREAREKEGGEPAAEKKDGAEEGKAASPTNGTGSVSGTAAEPSEGTQAVHSPRTDASGLMSPRTDSTGARTPTSRKPPRNPWTLFARLPVPANENELREFFGEAKAGITRVNYPNSFQGRQMRIAYVEFGDEDAMKAGLEKHAEKLNDAIPEVKQADREPREYHEGSQQQA